MEVTLKGGPWDGETRELPWDALEHLETPTGQAGVIWTHKYRRTVRGAKTAKYKGRSDPDFISARPIKVGWW